MQHAALAVVRDLEHQPRVGGVDKPAARRFGRIEEGLEDVHQEMADLGRQEVDEVDLRGGTAFPIIFAASALCCRRPPLRPCRRPPPLEAASEAVGRRASISDRAVEYSRGLPLGRSTFSANATAHAAAS